MKIIKIFMALFIVVLMVGSVVATTIYQKDSDGNVWATDDSGNTKLVTLSFMGMIKSIFGQKEDMGRAAQKPILTLAEAITYCNKDSTLNEIYKNSASSYCVRYNTETVNYCTNSGYTYFSDCSGGSGGGGTTPSPTTCTPNTAGCRATYYSWTCYDDGTKSEDDCRDNGAGYVCVQISSASGPAGVCRYVGDCKSGDVVPNSCYCNGNYLRCKQYTTTGDCSSTQDYSTPCASTCSNNKCVSDPKCVGKEGDDGCLDSTHSWFCSTTGIYSTTTCGSGKQCVLNNAGSAVCDFPSTTDCKSEGYPLGGCSPSTEDKCYTSYQKLSCDEVKTGLYCWTPVYCDEGCENGNCKIPITPPCTGVSCPTPGKICCYDNPWYTKESWWITDKTICENKYISFPDCNLDKCNKDDRCGGVLPPPTCKSNEELCKNKCVPKGTCEETPEPTGECKEKYVAKSDVVIAFTNILNSITFLTDPIKYLLFGGISDIDKNTVSDWFSKDHCSISRTKEEFKDATSSEIALSLCNKIDNCIIEEDQEVKCVLVKNAGIKVSLIEELVSEKDDQKVCLIDSGSPFDQILQWVKETFSVTSDGVAWGIFGAMIIIGIIVMMLLVSIVAPRRS